MFKLDTVWAVMLVIVCSRAAANVFIRVLQNYCILFYIVLELEDLLVAFFTGAVDCVVIHFVGKRFAVGRSLGCGCGGFLPSSLMA